MKKSLSGENIVSPNAFLSNKGGVVVITGTTNRGNKGIEVGRTKEKDVYLHNKKK